METSPSYPTSSQAGVCGGGGGGIPSGGAVPTAGSLVETVPNILV